MLCWKHTTRHSIYQEFSVFKRTCRGCLIEQALEDFPRKIDCAEGRSWRCQVCVNASQRARRQRNGNSDTKRHEKTPQGFLMRAYRNMKSRVTGVQKEKAHLYQGLPILPKEDFYAWSRDNVDFWRLFRQWVASGYDRRLTPSVNRVDPEQGYVFPNLEWITHSLNSGLARHRTDAAFQRIHASVAA